MRACRGKSRYYFAESLERRCLLSTNLVTNGSFEIPLVSATGMQTYTANSVNPLVGWTVGGGVATLGNSNTVAAFTFNAVTVGPFTFNAADGAASLNLGHGSVGQTITTVAGSSYRVAFSVGNVVDPSGLQFGTDSFVQLWINGKEADVAANSAGGNTVNWKPFTFPFTAAAGTTSTFVQFISFDSGHDGYCGLDAVSVTAPPPIAFIQQPSDAAAGDTIAPPVTVTLEDSSGHFLTDGTDLVTLALAPSTETGTLTGTLTQAAVNGIATFSNLSIDKGGNYNLIASDGSTPVLSSPFKITGDKLVFEPAPADGTANAPLKPIKVKLEDGGGNVETNDSSTVITLNPIGLASGNPIQNNTATVVNGIATFNKVILPQPGFYQLQASDPAGDAVATSGKFKVAGYKLVFSIQPKKPVDANIPIPIKVQLEDSKNKIVTTATSTLVLQMNTVTGGVGAQFNGTTMLPFVGGVAYFNPGPSINKTGTYTITATEEDTSLGALGPTNTTTPITTAPFSVGGYHLVFVKKPGKVNLGQGIIVSVDVEDSSRKRDKTLNSGGVHFDITPITGNTSATLKILHADTGFAMGLDSFTAANSLYVTGSFEGGTYMLTASATDSTGAIDSSIAPATFQPLTVQSDKLVFTAPPPPVVDVAEGIPCAIQLEDGSNKPITAPAEANITLAGPPEAVGNPGTYRLDNKGAVTFTEGTPTSSQNGVSISKAGTYSLTFEIAPNVAAVSKSFKVNGYHLAFIADPTSINYNEKESFTVAIENSRNAINTDDDTTQITVSNMANASKVTLSGGKYSFHDYLKDPLNTQYPPSKGNELVAVADTFPGGLTPVGNGTSKKFDIEGFRLAFLTQPARTTAAGSLVGFEVELIDSKNKVYSDNFDGVQIRLIPAPGSSAAPTLSGPTFSTFMNGDASFGGFTILTPGTYSIVATEVDQVANPLSSLVSGGTKDIISDQFTIS